MSAIKSNENKTKTLQLTFNTPGERTYYAKVDGTTYAVGTIKVESDDSSPPAPSGSIYIYSASASEEANSGDTVTFSIRVDNTYSQPKTVVVYLYVNGVQEDFEGGDVGAGGSRVFTLQWVVPEDILPGDYDYLIKVIHDGQTMDETAGTIAITTNKTQGVEIVSFTCTPKEVGLCEWKLDRDRVTCNLVIHNYGDSKIKVAPKVLIDNIETFWVDFREILADSNSSIKFEVKFDDELAKMVYGPSATALNFVQEVQEYEGVKCERNVCYNITKIYYLPKEHTIGVVVYKAENGVPTNQVLARITGETIKVEYDG